VTAAESPLVDAGERDRIAKDTDATLFVNAGAGSGKTSALVGRVQTLVLRDAVPLAQIAAVTFTEKAGAELRDRLRAKFEAVWRKATPGTEQRQRAAQALDDLDGAAIGTLHSFAQRILTEHPVEALLPPRLEILDEVASSVAFEDRWIQLRGALLDDDELAPALLLVLDAGVKLKHLRSLAHALGADWDLIDERVLTGPEPTLTTPDITDLLIQARAALDLRDDCSDPADKLLEAADPLAVLVEQAPGADDDVMPWLKSVAGLKFPGNKGRQVAWARPKAEVVQVWREVAENAASLHGRAVDAALRILVRWLAVRVKGEAERRRAEGRLEFHDLLVLTRDLLRSSADTRATLQSKYERLLLDEFQDTDPIQIELAVRIAAGAHGDAPDWRDIKVPEGRLFVVGDAKQSIYRFRRANIATYLRTRDLLGSSVELSTNFRTIPAVLDWVNAVFGRLIDEIPDQQPEYKALTPNRSGAGTGPSVLVLGADEPDEKLTAAQLRRAEAADVAAALGQALATPWQVHDERTKQWRDARAGDIAVLVPARTSLPYLTDALEEAGIPYRTESSSLVYQADEVRALLSTARAIADDSDSLSLVTALRSSFFGCGDDDLFRWRRAGGSFRLFRNLPRMPTQRWPEVRWRTGSPT
jgi:ATP-dependent exoDNAse (exonuclease V) beta subunit